VGLRRSPDSGRRLSVQARSSNLRRRHGPGLLLWSPSWLQGAVWSPTRLSLEADLSCYTATNTTLAVLYVAGQQCRNVLAVTHFLTRSIFDTRELRGRCSFVPRQQHNGKCRDYLTASGYRAKFWQHVLHTYVQRSVSVTLSLAVVAVVGSTPAKIMAALRHRYLPSCRNRVVHLPESSRLVFAAQ
jgi:hypothetical protein